MKIRTMTFLLTIICSTSLFCQPAPPLLRDTLRQKAAAAVTAGAYPSLVIGVVAGDRQEILPLGTVDDRQKRTPNADTVYEIGSVTKTFTALLLADAVERHEVSLEQAVQRLLPDYTIPKSGDVMITLLDLATQSSGLPRLPDNLLPKSPANPYAGYTTDRLKQFLAGYKLPRVPGASYEYSNLGFGLLGQALATHAGSTYGQLVHTRIAAPLSLNDTAIVPTPRMAERFTAGHDASGKSTSAWDLGALEGAGALRSTAHDLLLYVKALMHPPSGPLSKALAAVTQPRRATDRDQARIGLAWQIETRQGHTIIWHDGMTGGYASFAGFTADGERGAVVLTNISRDVAEIGFAALLPEPAARKFPPEKAITPAALAEYAGRYRLAPGFDLVVRVDGSELRVAATGQPENPVYARAADEFFFKVVDAQLSFKRGSDGAINAVVLDQNGRSMPAPRVTTESPAAAPRKQIKLKAAALQPFIGRYTLAPGFAIEVTAEDAQLYVQATGQERLPVFPSAPDEFFYKVVDAQLSFQRAADGSVEVVVLHQNGQHVKGRKQ